MKRAVFAILATVSLLCAVPSCAWLKAYNDYQEAQIRRWRREMRADGIEPLGPYRRVYVAPLHSPRYSYRGCRSHR